MTEFTLQFSSSVAADTGAYRLLELPADLSKLIDASLDGVDPRLTIKGNPDEDAVLCTADKTYTLRSVVLSNAILVVTPSPDASGEDNAAVIRQQLHEILELVPSAPRLAKLDALLRGREYDEVREDDDDDMYLGDSDGKLTYEAARETLQASDLELDQGLKKRRVLILNGELRPISPAYLIAILELLLTHLVSLSLSHAAASVDTLCSALERDYDIRTDVCEQVMAWFGEIIDNVWQMDKTAVVREIGLGLLRPYKDEPISIGEFLTKWRTSVGDTFEAEVSLDMLPGNVLTHLDTLKEPPATLLTYFPSAALPTDPAARFADLFLTQPRWRADDIAPFLDDICVDTKERDRMLLKYARAVTGAGGVWYTARTTVGK